MPELPEVETVARGLHSGLTGRRVLRTTLLDVKLQPLDLRPLKGAQIVGAQRIGKRVAVEFATTKGPRWLLVHLRMTGVLFYAPDGNLPEDKSAKHLRAIFELDQGRLLFYDPRRFGTIDLVDDIALAQPLGVEPLSRELTAARFTALLAGSSQPLKLWLLRQDKLVGLGNIYASEILFDSGLSPQRAAGSLSADEAAALLKSTKDILLKAIKHAGTTFSDFHNVNGEAGGFSRFLKVYGRGGQPCLRCGAVLTRFVQGQRSTFYCASCQR